MGKGRLYRWDVGSTFKVSAQVAGEYLDALREQNGGMLTPEIVVEAAKSEYSPIHKEFEWDFQKAAEKHWRERARNMISHIDIVRVQDDDPDAAVPAFVHVRLIDSGPAYVTMAQVVQVADWREFAIKDCLRMLKGLQKRYEQLTELDSIWAAIDEAEKARAKAGSTPKKKKK